MKEDHKFKQDFNASQEAVLKVAGYLQKIGREIMLPAIKFRPSNKERNNYRDQGDLKVLKTHQVKRRGLEFDSLESYPYPTVIVDEEYKINLQYQNPPQGYWVLNKNMSGAIFVSWDTKGEWIVEEKRDGEQKRECRFMVCPKEYCRYIGF